MVIDLTKQQVRFRVRESAAFEEKQLTETFAREGWKVMVLSRPDGAGGQEGGQ